MLELDWTINVIVLQSTTHQPQIDSSRPPNHGTNHPSSKRRTVCNGPKLSNGEQKKKLSQPMFTLSSDQNDQLLTYLILI